MFDLTVLGTELVQELSELIDQQVIVTNQYGLIVGSTDSSRLNTVHEGAKHAMESREELQMTEELTGKFQGVLPGIVLPIVICGSPIGVIGITGKPSEIESYAKLVRKVAELFVTEFMARQEREREMREMELFLFDLLTAEVTEDSLVDRARWLNVEVSDPYRVAVIQSNKAFELTEVESMLQSQRIHPDVKLIRWGVGKLVFIIPDLPSSQLKVRLEDFEQILKRKVAGPIRIGVGESKPFSLLRESFRQAEMAAAASGKLGKVVFEEELKLELLFYSLSGEIKEEYIRRTIEPLSGEGDLFQTLKAWSESTGSLQEVADELHIHKNTLKYRLRKIEELLGLDFGNKEHIAIVAVAIGLMTTT